MHLSFFVRSAMKIGEICRRYGLSGGEIQFYIRKGILPEPQEDELSDEGLKRLGTVLLLRRAGLPDEKIEEYFGRDGRSCSGRRIRILRELRDRLLDEIHEREKLLGSFDCILYELKQGGE